MEWTDEGIVIGVRRHGEANAIVEVLTMDHGRHLGLVRGGASARQRPVLQPGNGVRVTWRARLDEHLGHYVVEGTRLRAASYLSSPHALFGLTHLCALARLLPERDPHPALHDILDHLLDQLGTESEAARQVVQFELHLLTELGFGLDLAECAATGRRDDLIYVSPRSGRAICRDAGAPWREKLLQLPAFLSHTDGASGPVSHGDIAAGFALTGFFLCRYVLDPRGETLPDARAQFIAHVLRSGSAAAVERPSASAASSS